MSLLKPLRAEEVLRQEGFPSIDHKRLAADYDMDKDQLFEFSWTEVANLVARHSLDPFEIRRSIDKRVQIQVGRDGVEFRLGVH